MRIYKSYILVLLLLPFFVANNQGKSEIGPLRDHEGSYHILIISSRWEFEFIDLVEASLILEIELEMIEEYFNESREISNYGDSITLFTGSEVQFYIVSSDVQHGVAINALSMNIATIRPQPGSEFGDPIYVITTLPSEPTSIEGFCHIFCGLGHPNQTFSLEIIYEDGSLLPFSTESSQELVVRTSDESITFDAVVNVTAIVLSFAFSAILINNIRIKLNRKLI